MVTQVKSPQKPDVIYPDSDGQPMSDNTKQFRWILIIQQNLAWLFGDDPNVFVAGDLLWYPVEGDNKIRVGPDVMVVFGRPKGDRGSYKQWEEENIAPQVVFEILSPGKRLTEMNKKQVFYDRHGVEEYYLYDPERNDFSGWMRSQGRLDVIDAIENWVSPRLGIRFDLSGEELQIYRPDGEPFASYEEVSRSLEQAEQRAEQAEQRAEQAEQRAALLAERLRSMGIDPEQL
ncbi:Uma2 family endonuclease [Microcoleus sp. BROC3]|uniref:Uma2 family endonuclease n=1 Tax=Microcoleus sp. BROC3 TaxID=3055323 RepID=UPI002FD07E7B